MIATRWGTRAAFDRLEAMIVRVAPRLIDRALAAGVCSCSIRCRRHAMPASRVPSRRGTVRRQLAARQILAGEWRRVPDSAAAASVKTCPGLRRSATSWATASKNSAAGPMSAHPTCATPSAYAHGVRVAGASRSRSNGCRMGAARSIRPVPNLSNILSTFVSVGSDS